MTDKQNTEEQMTVGAYLKRLRNEKNMTVADVAAKLYLQTHVIEALEQDDHENLPLPIYVYGYLQNYARLLGVPVDEVVAMYKKHTTEPGKQAPEAPALMELEEKQQIRWSHLVIYLLLFVLILMSFAYWRSRYALETPEVADSPDSPVTIVELSPGEAPDTETGEIDQATETAELPESEPDTALGQEPDTAPGHELDTALGQEPAGEVETAPEPDAESPAAQVQLTEAETASDDSEPEAIPTYEETTVIYGTGPDTIRLVLNTDCWIEVFDAENRKVFYDLARIGQTLILNGDAPFSVLLGNADAATVEFNNAPFDITPHVTGIGIARFVLGDDQ